MGRFRVPLWAWRLEYVASVLKVLWKGRPWLGPRAAWLPENAHSWHGLAKFHWLSSPTCITGWRYSQKKKDNSGHQAQKNNPPSSWTVCPAAFTTKFNIVLAVKKMCSNCPIHVLGAGPKEWTLSWEAMRWSLIH